MSLQQAARDDGKDKVMLSPNFPIICSCRKWAPPVVLRSAVLVPPASPFRVWTECLLRMRHRVQPSLPAMHDVSPPAADPSPYDEETCKAHSARLRGAKLTVDAIRDFVFKKSEDLPEGFSKKARKKRFRSKLT